MQGRQAATRRAVLPTARPACQGASAGRCSAATPSSSAHPSSSARRCPGACCPAAGGCAVARCSAARRSAQLAQHADVIRDSRSTGTAQQLVAARDKYSGIIQAACHSSHLPLAQEAQCIAIVLAKGRWWIRVGFHASEPARNHGNRQRVASAVPPPTGQPCLVIGDCLNRGSSPIAFPHRVPWRLRHPRLEQAIATRST
jgi:hypothetical protein